MTEAEQAFMTELTALTKKHSIAIGGCGCCGSPWLEAKEIVDGGRYIINEAYTNQIVYVQPGDYYWNKNKVQA